MGGKLEPIGCLWIVMHCSNCMMMLMSLGLGNFLSSACMTYTRYESAVLCNFLSLAGQLDIGRLYLAHAHVFLTAACSAQRDVRHDARLRWRGAPGMGAGEVQLQKPIQGSWQGPFQGQTRLGPLNPLLPCHATLLCWRVPGPLSDSVCCLPSAALPSALGPPLSDLCFDWWHSTFRVHTSRPICSWSAA